MHLSRTSGSIDGAGAFDLVSRGAMSQGLRDVSPAALPLVRQVYGNPSRHMWEDGEGTVHEIDQGKRREQGNALKPLLFSSRQQKERFHPKKITFIQTFG